ncbi:hypothetical protein JJB99_34120 [Bradyrhizobium diazoefficiens]|uniref:hypothetical protein n=1 Tax=Bradyrhizobium diazoefficiens TaxID=1355477 RepID=UPI001909ED56|nr:hypothetical protein [Bradyrhizobium diazoefficiens]QQO14278.1 hypothetical protein JJB99_34120 [Bradyrhizobium diazoefficiens]
MDNGGSHASFIDLRDGSKNLHAAPDETYSSPQHCLMKMTLADDSKGYANTGIRWDAGSVVTRFLSVVTWRAAAKPDAASYVAIE